MPTSPTPRPSTITAPAGTGSPHGKAVGGEYHTVAVLTDINILFRNAYGSSRLGVLFQMLVFAVHRQEELGLCQREHQLLLLLAGVARNMHVIHGFVDDLGPSFKRPLTTFVTIFSLPGIGFAEMMIKSPSPTRTLR